MSDIDQQLAAAYDSAASSGANVIDTTTGHVEPDTRPRDERPIDSWVRDKDEHRASSDAWDERLGKAFDQSVSRQQQAEDDIPPMPPSMEASAENAARWLEMPLAERQAHHQVGKVATDVREFAKLHGISEEAISDFLMSRVAKGMDGQQAAQQSEVSEPLRQLVPGAQTQEDVARAVAPYAEFEAAYQQPRLAGIHRCCGPARSQIIRPIEPAARRSPCKLTACRLAR